MAKVDANGIQIEYETFGDPASPALLLIIGSVAIPALVIHGSVDPVVPVGCGQSTAQAIPGAKLLIIEGMGHDLPHGGAWPQIVDAIVDHTHRVGF